MHPGKCTSPVLCGDCLTGEGRRASDGCAHAGAWTRGDQQLTSNPLLPARRIALRSDICPLARRQPTMPHSSSLLSFLFQGTRSSPPPALPRPQPITRTTQSTPCAACISPAPHRARDADSHIAAATRRALIRHRYRIIQQEITCDLYITTVSRFIRYKTQIIGTTVRRLDALPPVRVIRFGPPCFDAVSNLRRNGWQWPTYSPWTRRGWPGNLNGSANPGGDSTG